MADAVEDALESMEELERRLSHESQHIVRCVLRCHFKASADMVEDELAGVVACGLVELRVAPVVEKKVIAHAAAYVGMSHGRMCRHAAVYVKQWRMVALKVRADVRCHARRSCAVAACRLLASVHAVHVGRGPSEVADGAVEVGHADHGFHFAHDAFLGSRADELPLMCADGAEGASSEASPMQTDGMAYHLVGRDAVAAVFGMRQTRIWQVEAVVDLFCCHGRKRWIDHDP